MILSEPEPIITINDLIPPYCAWGVRHWFTQHGLNFRDFLQNGIPASRLLATGDGQAVEAVQRKLGGDRGRGF